MAAVQRDEGTVISFQCIERLRCRVEGMGINALPLQRRKHARTTVEGNLTFGGGSTKQDGDFAKIRHALLQTAFHFWAFFPVDRGASSCIYGRGCSYLPRHFPGNGANRAGPHAQHHVTIAGDIHNRLRHIRNILDEHRLHLAGNPQRTRH